MLGQQVDHVGRRAPSILFKALQSGQRDAHPLGQAGLIEQQRFAARLEALAERRGIDGFGGRTGIVRVSVRIAR